MMSKTQQINILTLFTYPQRPRDYHSMNFLLNPYFQHVYLLVALRWLHGCMQLQLCINSFLIVFCSTILNYIYHLCALDVVASGIDDIIVQTVSVLKKEYSFRITTKSSTWLNKRREHRPHHTSKLPIHLLDLVLRKFVALHMWSES
jgi:hypothetical protein